VSLYLLSLSREYLSHDLQTSPPRSDPSFFFVKLYSFISFLLFSSEAKNTKPQKQSKTLILEKGVLGVNRPSSECGLSFAKSGSKLKLISKAECAGATFKIAQGETFSVADRDTISGVLPNVFGGDDGDPTNWNMKPADKKLELSYGPDDVVLFGKSVLQTIKAVAVEDVFVIFLDVKGVFVRCWYPY